MRRLRIAVVSPYTPGARDAGERVRLGALIDELSDVHDVVIFSWEKSELGALDPGGLALRMPAPRRRIRARLRSSDYVWAFLGGSLVQWAAIRRRVGVRAWVKREMRTFAPDVVIASQLSGLAAVPRHLRHRTLVDTHNAEGLRWQRIAQAQDDLGKRTLARQQALAARSLERKVGRQVVSMLSVSAEDARYFSDMGVTAHVVPNGFRPPQQQVRKRFDEVKALFLGSFDYSANRDALEWLVEISDSFPAGVTLSVAGSGDSRPVEALFEGSKMVSVIGRVDDVAELYRSHNVLLAPLRMGGGSRLKILEAIGNGLLVISTRVGAEGLPLQPEEDFLTAESTIEWRTALQRVLLDSLAMQTMTDHAALKIADLTWKSSGMAFRRILDERF